MVHDQQGEEHVEESFVEYTSHLEAKDQLENTFENTEGDLLSAGQQAKQLRQLSLLDKIKVEHLNNDVDDEDSSLQIIENMDDHNSLDQVLAKKN